MGQFGYQEFGKRSGFGKALARLALELLSGGFARQVLNTKYLERPIFIDESSGA